MVVTGISSEALMKTLSDDAKVVAGGCFGMMSAGKGVLEFSMRKSRPTRRMQAALDELVEAGAITKEPLDDSPNGVRYRVQMDCSDFFRWLGRNSDKGHWPVVETIEVATNAAS